MDGAVVMSRKDFIALADVIRAHNKRAQAIFGANSQRMSFSLETLDTLADFCAKQNPRFDRALWLDYIAGKCGPRGGKV